MKADYTHIIFLIDRSGSMSSIQKDMEGGIKEFLAKQRELPGQCTITAAQFDTDYEILHSLKSLTEVQELKINPRGGTALIDSMVRLIKESGKELASLPESERPERVLFVAITDGEENSSREYKNDALKELIKEQEDKYNWQFTYLGANQDAFSVAGGFGLASNKSMNYNASTTGISAAFMTLNDATVRYRSANSADLNKDSFSYTTQEQESTANA